MIIYVHRCDGPETDHYNKTRKNPKRHILKKNNNLGNLNEQQKTAKISHVLVKDGLEVKRGMLKEEKPQTNKIERKGRRKKY